MSIGQFIDKVGIEIEGLWFEADGFQGKKVCANHPIEHDGSLKFGDNYKNRILEQIKSLHAAGKLPSSNPKHFVRIGEVISKPINSMESALQFIHDNWPDQSNRTCGLHFHISTKNPGHYSALMDDEFGVYFREQIREFSKEANSVLKGRILGTNEHALKYCRDEFRPAKQAYVTKKVYRNHDPEAGRYTILNYCYGLHKTMECRVFTTHMSANRGARCLEWFVSTIENFLANNYERLSNSEVQQSFEVEVEDRKTNFNHHEIAEVITKNNVMLIDEDVIGVV